MKWPKLLGYFSQSCALLGGIIGLGISTTVLINIVIDRNWSATPFLLLLALGNLVILIYNVRASKVRKLSLINVGIGLMQVFFIYLARFSIGIFLIPPTLLLLIAAILDFVVHKIQLGGKQSIQPNPNLHSSPNKQRDLDQELTSDLTSRERQILLLLMQASSNQEIAQGLYISQNTVRHHVHQILKKLNCSSRAQAAAIGRKEGLNLEVIPVQNSKSNSG